MRNNPRLFIHLSVLNTQSLQFKSKFSFYVMSVEKEGMFLLLLRLFVFCEQVGLEMWILCHVWTLHMSHGKSIPAIRFQTQC